MVCHEEGEFHGGTYDMYLSVVEWESLAVGHTKCISLSWGKVSGVSGGTHDIVQEFTGGTHDIVREFTGGTHDIVRKFTGGTH